MIAAMISRKPVAAFAKMWLLNSEFKMENKG